MVDSANALQTMDSGRLKSVWRAALIAECDADAARSPGSTFVLFVTLVVMVAIGFAAQQTSAQTLNLDLPGGRVERPELGDDNAAAALLYALEGERADMAEEPVPPSHDDCLARRVQLAYLDLCLALLRGVSDGGDASDAAAVAAFRLAHDRDELKALVKSWLNSTVDDRRIEVGDALEEFVTRVATLAERHDRATQFTSAEQIGRTVTHVLNPLISIAIMVQGLAGDADLHLPGRHELADIANRLQRSQAILGPELAVKVGDVIHGLQQEGYHVGESRRAMDLLCAALTAMEMTGDDLPPHRAIDESLKQAAEQAVDGLVDAVDALDSLDSRDIDLLTQRLRLATDLYQHVKALRRLGRSEVRALEETLETLLEGPVAYWSEARLQLMNRSLNKASEMRHFSPGRMRLEFRAVDARLAELARFFERRTLRSLPDLVLTGDPLSNPAMNSLLTEQRQLLGDRHRLSRIDDWLDEIERIEPPAREGVTRQFRKMCMWLMDPMKRDDAVRAMSRFEWQIEAFARLPLEDALRGQDPLVVRLTGGREAQLLELIDENRRQWATAWSIGDAASAPAQRLALLFRLMWIMNGHIEMSIAERSGPIIEQVAVLQGNMSSAYGCACLCSKHWLPPGLSERLNRGLGEELMHATAQALNDELSRFRGLLERLEQNHALAILVYQVSTQDVRQGRSTVNCDAIFRCAVEREYAARRGDDDLAAALDRWINRESQRLSSRLGDNVPGLKSNSVVEATLTPITGFDGSDPVPEIEIDRRHGPRPRR